MVATYWAVFALGRAIVGRAQAAIAVLLMVGISLFTVPTPDFGPAILTMPLWALVLLHYWRAVGEGRRALRGSRSALDVGAAPAHQLCGAVLLGLLVLFTAVTRARPRGARRREPWIAGIALAVLSVPHLHLAARHRRQCCRRRSPGCATPRDAVAGNHVAWLRLLGALVLRPCRARRPHRLVSRLAARQARAGAGRSRGCRSTRRAAQFVYFFTLVPALLATVAGGAARQRAADRRRRAAGRALRPRRRDRGRRRIALNHQRGVSLAWVGPAGGAGAVRAGGHGRCCRGRLGIDLTIDQPADADGPVLRRQLRAPHRQGRCRS